MIRRWVSQKQFYLLGVTLGLVIAAIAVFWPNLLAFSDAHNGLAAWVQAVGSILAILWAIILWRGDVAQTKREVESRARVVAFRVAPLLFDIEIALNVALESLEIIEKKLGVEPPDDLIFGIRKSMVLPLPADPSIYDGFNCLPPDLAFRLVYLFYTIERANRQMGTLLELAAKNPEQIIPKLITTQRPALNRIKADVGTLIPIFAKEFSCHLPETA